MTLRLHNNLTRQLEPFTLLDPACPTLYVCGPTVLQLRAHRQRPWPGGVRGCRPAAAPFRSRYARNITDVDDKINTAAREQGVPISTITDRLPPPTVRTWPRWAWCRRTSSRR